MFAFPVSHWGTGGAITLPAHSIDFESSSNQYLSMPVADFGSYDNAKFAVSVWFKRESINADQGIIEHMGGVGQRAFQLQIENNGISFYTYNDGSNVNGGLNTTATYTSTSSWYHLLAWFDSANATAGDRMRLWMNGSEVTSFSYDQNPTGSAHTSTADVHISSSASAADFDGLIYQFGFFSGSLPSISDVYNSGSPKDISGLAGLWSYLDCAGNDPTSDGVLATNWTNNNTATTSTDIPT
jgi:hypothetical protein